MYGVEFCYKALPSAGDDELQLLPLQLLYSNLEDFLEEMMP